MPLYMRVEVSGAIRARNFLGREIYGTRNLLSAYRSAVIVETSGTMANPSDVEEPKKEEQMEEKEKLNMVSLFVCFWTPWQIMMDNLADTHSAIAFLRLSLISFIMI